MWWTLLAPIATSIFGKDGIIGTYISTKQAIEQKKQDNAYLLEVSRNDLIKQQGIDEVEREKLRVANAAPAWFKFVSYVLLNYPLILAFISDEKGKAAFKTIESIPMWYAMLYVGVVSVIWGLPVASNWMQNVFGAMQQAWAVRQDKKIEKIQALGDANLITFDQAVKMAYDVQRKLSPNGMLSPQQVEAMRPTIEAEAARATTNNATVNTGDNQ